MARSKNRRKKPKPTKKTSPTKKRKKTATEASEAPPELKTDESDYLSDSDYSGGMLVGMRNMVSGGGQAQDNVFSKRRSLGEWLLWFTLIGLIVYGIQYFMDK